MSTKIEWLANPDGFRGVTWNPIAMRCDRCSPGCNHCWHLRQAARDAHNPILAPELRIARAGGPFALMQDVLQQPLYWRKPRRVGVQFMGDLWHEKVPDEWVSQVMTTAYLCEDNTFLFLTKRANRMAEYFAKLTVGKAGLGKALNDIGHDSLATRLFLAGKMKIAEDGQPPYRIAPNIWLGVTICNQREADEKLPIHVRIPAAVRYVSFEPLLADIDIERYVMSCVDCGNQGSVAFDDRPGKTPRLCKQACIKGGESPALDWVIIGAETGPGARPCNLYWIDHILTQCEAAGVPPFIKAVRDDKGRLATDINKISSMLGRPPEQLRRMPERNGM